MLAGVVEGFYGKPWSFEERKQLFRWLKSAGLNTYLYAPKDDLKHRTDWRTPYSPGELKELTALIGAARQAGLRFIYGIAPGLDIRYGVEKDFAILRRKTGQLEKAGCDSFALLFDDIPSEMRPEEQRRFGSIAAAQSAVANRFYILERQRANWKGVVLFCPTIYCDRMAGSVRKNAYLRQLGSQLERGMEVLWTGPEIISERIHEKDIRNVAAVLKRKPVLWDNLHANDYDGRRCFTGPYSGRTLGIRKEVSGILTNPNCELELNFVPVRTFGQFARGKPYHPMKAFKEALDAWKPLWACAAGREITTSELELLCHCFFLPFEFGPRAQNWIGALRRMMADPPAEWGRLEKTARAAAREFEALFDRMLRLKNRELLHAWYRKIWEIKEELLFLNQFLEWRRGRGGGGIFRSWQYRPELFHGGFTAELQRLVQPRDGGWIS